MISGEGADVRKKSESFFRTSRAPPETRMMEETCIPDLERWLMCSHVLGTHACLHMHTQTKTNSRLQLLHSARQTQPRVNFLDKNSVTLEPRNGTYRCGGQSFAAFSGLAKRCSR
jgi:hypothetical protein